MEKKWYCIAAPESKDVVACFGDKLAWAETTLTEIKNDDNDSWSSFICEDRKTMLIQGWTGKRYSYLLNYAKTYSSKGVFLWRYTDSPGDILPVSTYQPSCYAEPLPLP